MRLNKLFLIGAVALGIGLTACNNNDEVPNPDQQTKGSTYVGISIALPGAKATTRALPEDYNSNGEWTGRDKIENITVFLVNTSAKTVNYTTFDKDAFNGITPEGVLKPIKAIKATPGHNVKAYVVVNGKQSILDDLKTTSAEAFANAFVAAEATALASEVAEYDSSDKKEKVMMTNTTLPEVTVAPSISETEAINNTKRTNRIDVSVGRVVSRAIVTMAPNLGTSTVQVKDAQGNAVPGSVITISDVVYAVGQSNKKFYITEKNTTTYEVPDPVYSYVPSSGNWSTTGKANFDYTGLQDFTAVQEITDKANDKVVNALNNEATSKFVLPVTHEDEQHYKKGNTTYFEIRATFTPKEVDGSTYTSGTTDFFLGTNDGKFYSTQAKATANGQKAIKYTGGVMKYVLWLNPDKLYDGTQGKIRKSPTVRNQVYHAHITGFKEIGVNANPLNPDTPGDPDNPIDPEDPLQTDDTYLSVQVSVLKWGVHSYNVDLGNDY